MNSPIRYYGGKGGMFKRILAEFPPDFGVETRTCNDGSGDIYVEPFGGSASILFHKKPSPIEIYNDLDQNVYALFHVLADKEEFVEFKRRCDLTYYSREIFDEYVKSLKGDLEIQERAFRFFYVNRIAYNGVGSFSCIVNAVRRGMSKPVSDMLSTVSRLPDIHQRLSSVIVEKVDAVKLIKKYDKPSAFFYLDPPYHHSARRSTARYNVDMSDEQQEDLVKLLLKTENARILLSGYRCKLYDRLTDSGWHRVDFVVKTQSDKRQPRSKTESLWRNY